jgi:4-azaleucine resistance transporter AzlC
MTNLTRRAEFWAGFRATLPIIVGDFPGGIIFGVLAIGSGISPLGALAMSLFVYAGSAQFIGVRLVSQGVGLGVIVLVTFIVNLRNTLYGVTISPYIKGLSRPWVLLLSLWLVDETFIISMGRYRQPDASHYKHWYYLGAAVLLYISWAVSTAIGLVAGQAVSGLSDLGLDFAVTATFLALLIPLIKDRALLAAAVTAGVSAVVFYQLPNQLGLMLAILLGVAGGMLVERRTYPTQPSVESSSL